MNRCRLSSVVSVGFMLGALQRIQSLEAPLPSRDSSSVAPSSRRAWLATTGVLASSCASALLPSRCVPTAEAAVTDETDRFADNWWESTAGLPPASSPLPLPPSLQSQAATDEVRITVPKSAVKDRGGLGLELAEIEFRTMLRVYVKSVAPGSLASELGIQKDWIAVSVNGLSVERTNARGVTSVLADALRPNSGSGGGAVELVFRDPSAFRERLQNMSADQPITTQVAPAGETTQRNPDGSIKTGRSVTMQTDQKVTVAQLVPPRMCHRGASFEDLLEISYVGRVLETGQIFDGSAVLINDHGIPGRGNDVSLYFVLGKQPFGQFPPGWDVGLVGMCVGERRRLIIPPALAYGPNGLPRRGIPPDATLQYDITLVSLNGLSTPQ